MSHDNTLAGRPLARPHLLQHHLHRRVSSPARHPRRPPANESVSLKHASRRNATSTSPDHSHDAASSLVNNLGSPNGSSNEQVWFDASNNNPKPAGGNPIENEPPFFLGGSSGGTPLKSNSRGDASSDPAQADDFPPGPIRRESADDALGEFRDVIDDLTVENKRLSKRLRRAERNRSSVLDSEKLFEVKFQGLSSSEKSELERLLKRFALGLGEPSPRNQAELAGNAAPKAANAPKPSSSHTSTKFADSGYGSMTTSNTRFAHRYSATPAVIPTVNSAEASKARDRNIHSYLHDIPEGLLPRESPANMTDTTKKRLAVLRLEQLFSGTGVASGGHQQPLQQQEVSQLAARDDKSALEARGQYARPEGIREALIMDESAESSSHGAPTGALDGSVTQHGTSAYASGTEEAVEEQRPTRPLDLDPHRAQDPTENVGYVKHLGFSMPNPSLRDHIDQTGDWIYLNLLFNMAQLHTLNVTPALVKTALQEYSTKFELSESCRKLRWNPRRAPKDVADTSTSEPTASMQLQNDASSLSNTDLITNVAAGQKRPRPNYLDAQALSRNDTLISKKPSSSPATWSKPSTLNPRSSDAVQGDEVPSESMDPYDSEEPPQITLSEEPPLTFDPFDPLHTALSHSSAGHGSDGPMIFYANRRFYLDLSGDRSCRPQAYGNVRLRVPSSIPLGAKSPSEDESSESSQEAVLVTGSDSGSLEVNTDMGPVHGSLRLDRDADAAATHDAAAARAFPLEATGIGYVYPSDNFVIFVDRDCGPARIFKDLQNAPPDSKVTVKPLDARKDGPPPAKRAKIVSQRCIELEPFKLPSPTYAYSEPDTNMDDSEGENEALDNDDDDMSLDSSLPGSQSDMSQDPPDDASGMDAPDQSHDPESGGASMRSDERTTLVHGDSNAYSSRPGAGASSRMAVSTAPNDGTSDADDEDDDSQSLDFLATAREIDPAAVRAREREYDAQMADRLAEEIPAGSSAATCGGGKGSGYNSPVLGVRTSSSHARAANNAAGLCTAGGVGAGVDRMDEDEDSSAEAEGSVSS